METNKLVAGIVAAAIAVIVLAGVLMPALDNATTTSKTFSNQGRYYVTTDIADDVTIEMKYDIEGGTRQWYIDDVLLEYTTIPGLEYVATPTVVGADDLVFRTDGRARGLTSSAGNNDYTVNVTNSAITFGAVTSHAPMFVASTSATDKVMRYSNVSEAYLKGSSEIIGCGYTLVDNNTTNIVVSFTGTIKDGVTISVYNSDYEYTVSNVKINADAVGGYTDLYKYNSVTFDVTNTTSEITTSCTYSVVVIPSEVTAEKFGRLSDPMNAILNVLPILIIVAVLLAVVSIFIIRRE